MRRIALVALLGLVVVLAGCVSHQKQKIVQNGQQLGTIDTVVTTGDGSTCTVTLGGNHYTVQSGFATEDCVNTKTGDVLYKDGEGVYWILTPQEVRKHGGVVK